MHLHFGDGAPHILVQLEPELASVGLRLGIGSPIVGAVFVFAGDLAVVAAVTDRGVENKDLAHLDSPSSRRLTKDDVSPPGHDGHAQDKDAGSTNSSAIGATEDDVLCRPVRFGGRDFTFHQPPVPTPRSEDPMPGHNPWQRPPGTSLSTTPSPSWSPSARRRGSRSSPCPSSWVRSR